MQGIPCFWPHKNASQVQFGAYLVYNGGGEAAMFNNVISQFLPAGIATTYATGGDSGSPQFTAVGTNVVLVTTGHTVTQNYDYISGPLWSDPTVFASLVSLGLTNGMTFVNLSGYTSY